MKCNKIQQVHLARNLKCHLFSIGYIKVPKKTYTRHRCVLSPRPLDATVEDAETQLCPIVDGFLGINFRVKNQTNINDIINSELAVIAVLALARIMCAYIYSQNGSAILAQA